MASRRILTIRIPADGPGAYRKALATSPLAAGFDAGIRERGLDRLALAIAESALEDALADAAALKENRDLLQEELRASRLKLNESETLLTGARCLGRQQLREIGELHSLLAEEAAASKNVTRRIDEKVAERVADLVQRIDVYQCELAGLRADRDAGHALIRRSLEAASNAPLRWLTGLERHELLEAMRRHIEVTADA